MSFLDGGVISSGASIDELIDQFARMQKQLEFMMMGNLGSKNIREVGDFLVGQNSFMSRNGMVGISSLVTGSNDIRIWAGDVVPETAPFRVYEDGQVIATNADLSGKITATSGQIGGWTIAEDMLFGLGKIVGGDILGTSITGALIQTEVAGSYPRIELSDTQNLLKAESSGTDYVVLYSSYLGNPTYQFVTSSALINVALIGGKFNLSGVGDINIQTGNGRIDLNAPSGVFANGVPL